MVPGGPLQTRFPSVFIASSKRPSHDLRSSPASRPCPGSMTPHAVGFGGTGVGAAVGKSGAYRRKSVAIKDVPPMPSRPHERVEYCPTHGVYVYIAAVAAFAGVMLHGSEVSL